MGGEGIETVNIDNSDEYFLCTGTREIEEGYEDSTLFPSLSI